MTPEPAEEWNALRAEQSALRARLEALERRLARFEEVPLPVIPPSAGVPPPLPASLPAMPVLAPHESIEARIGSAWLVRAGVVLLLTSLAFLGDYLYRNVVFELGALAKVGLLYLGAGLLVGLGAWLEHSRAARANPGLRNYAGVVLGAGLAAVYYVTYAARYYPTLRVIGSPLLAGVLLIGWTAFMVWVADRRGSQTLATLAILLAFYTSAINEITGFTLASNVPLTVAAVFLMRRHLWRIFPFASLLATYGSYGGWRVFHAVTVFADTVHGRRHVGYAAGEGFWIDGAFLLVYWALFTWAVFATSERTLRATRRAGFASLNNGAFFVLATWLVLADYPAAFWKWSLIFGSVLLALAETGRRLPRRVDRATENAFGLEGVLLITVGWCAYFAGWQLSVALAAQSVILLAAARQRESRWALWSSVATAVLAVGAALPQTAAFGADRFRWLGPALAAAMGCNAWWSDRGRGGAVTMSTPLSAAGGVYEGLAVLLGLIGVGGMFLGRNSSLSLVWRAARSSPSGSKRGAGGGCSGATW